MENLRFEQWCKYAVERIKYKPDRKAVMLELYAHMEDKYEELVEQGIPLREAEKKTVEAMGDPRKVGEQLARVHRPFWGYVLRATRWILTIVMIALCFKLPNFIEENNYTDNSADVTGRNVYTAENDEYGKKVKHLKTDVTVYSNGYAITLTEAVQWHDDYIGYEGKRVIEDEFFFTIEISHPLPWMLSSYMPMMMYGVDSLGNYYYSCYEYGYANEPAILGNAYRTGFFTSTCQMWATNFASQEAEWLELRYERDGKEISLRIDLTEGGAP